MPKLNFISSVPVLLDAIADGGELVMAHDHNAHEEWYLVKTRASGPTRRRVLASTAHAARRKGYLVPTGLLYWNLSVAGERATKGGKP